MIYILMALFLIVNCALAGLVMGTFIQARQSPETPEDNELSAEELIKQAKIKAEIQNFLNYSGEEQR